MADAAIQESPSALRPLDCFATLATTIPLDGEARQIDRRPTEAPALTP